VFDRRTTAATVVVAVLIAGFAAWGLHHYLADRRVQAQLEDKYGGRSTEIKPGQSLLIPKNTDVGFAKIEAKGGGDTFQVMTMHVLPGLLEVDVAVGATEHGYEYYPSSGRVVAVPVTITGRQSIAGLSFPASQFAPTVVGRLADEVRHADPALHITALTLQADPAAPAGAPARWYVSTEGAGRTGIGFAADIDGRHFVAQ
jgi:hypothetical protein